MSPENSDFAISAIRLRLTRMVASSAHFKQRYRFDMRGMREHIHHPRCFQRVAVNLHQYLRIARQRGGITAHIDDAAWRIFSATSKGFNQLDRAIARRVDQQLVELPQPGESLFAHFE